MLIHPWDAPQDDAEWQDWLAARDFGQLAVNGAAGEPPWVQPMHFAYDPARGEAVTHLARANPLVPAIEADPDVVLSVVDDYAYVPGAWQAAEDEPPEHGVPTSFYATVQLRCTAHIARGARDTADLLARQMAHFDPDGLQAPVAPGEPPYGRLLAGIRAVRLSVTGVRAKFKYAGSRTTPVRARIATNLATRSSPGDLASRDHLLRRMSRPRR